jgi:hypothetical protein
MVMGVFMAVLMVGLLYYVKGLGDAIAFRERMQDAADSGAFASATTHARGMNLIVLINISMVVVLAMGAIARLVVFMAALAGAGGVGGQAAGIENGVVDVLYVAHRTADALTTAIPLAGAARARAIASSPAFAPAFDGVTGYPAGARLPIEESSAEEFVSRAGVSFVPVALWAFTDDEIDRIYQNADAYALVAESHNGARAILAAHHVRLRRLTDDVVRGGERLQVRIMIQDEFDFALADRGVSIANMGQTETATENQRGLNTLSRISFAQGEYYYAGEEERDEWLWNQNWLARLRRVRLADPGGYPCAAPSDYCDALDQLFERGLHRAVVH